MESDGDEDGGSQESAGFVDGAHEIGDGYGEEEAPDKSKLILWQHINKIVLLG